MSIWQNPSAQNVCVRARVNLLTALQPQACSCMFVAVVRVLCTFRFSDAEKGNFEKGLVEPFFAFSRERGLGLSSYSVPRAPTALQPHACVRRFVAVVSVSCTFPVLKFQNLRNWTVSKNQKYLISSYYYQVFISCFLVDTGPISRIFKMFWAISSSFSGPAFSEIDNILGF